MNITIVGAGSSTASALIPMLLDETDARVHLVSSQELPYASSRVVCDVVDITDRSALKESVMRALPNAIVNTAAMTNVDACEQEKQLARTLNATVVEHLVRIARATDALLVHLSTDYVFDGEAGPYTELDVPSPINYYGKSKLAGENALTTAGIDYAILRTNVVYGPPSVRPDFLQWVIKHLDEEKSFKVVTDQFSNPTYVDDLALAIIRVIERKKTGLFHVGGADYVSRFEFAQKVAAFFKVEPSLVQPITTADLAQTAKRPLRGGLISLKAETSLGLRLRGIESGLVSVRHVMMGD
jgi:dTDP-4-dehydrorhamnose reductase